MYGISRLRNYRHIPGIGYGLNQMNVSFFASHGCHCFFFRVKHNSIPSFIPVGYGKTKFIDTFTYGVTVIFRFLGSFHQFVNYMSRCRSVRVAHRKVYDILSRPSRFHFYLIDFGKNIIWKSVYGIKLYLFKHFLSLFVSLFAVYF